MRRGLGVGAALVTAGLVVGGAMIWQIQARVTSA